MLGKKCFIFAGLAVDQPILQVLSSRHSEDLLLQEQVMPYELNRRIYFGCILEHLHIRAAWQFPIPHQEILDLLPNDSKKHRLD